MAFKKRCIGLLAAIAVSCLGLARNALAAGDVVISQVWGGGGSGVGAVSPNADYVELYNRTPNPIDMSAWSLQTCLPTGTSWQKLDLFATIQPYSYYLVRVSAAGAGSTVFVQADAAFSPTNNTLQVTGGKVALRNNQFSLNPSVDPVHGLPGCPASDASIVDFVGFGVDSSGQPADCREGVSPADNAPAGSATDAGLTPIRTATGALTPTTTRRTSCSARQAHATARLLPEPLAARRGHAATR